MTATPPPGPPSDPDPGPPPAGPWASDDLPPHPLVTGVEVEQPRSILTAVRLMWVGAALTGIGVLITLLQIDAIRDQIEEDDPGLSSGEVDSAVAGFVAVSVVAGIIAIGLWLWMAQANGRGLRWARGVATGLGVVNVVFTAFGLATGPGTALSTLFALVGITLAVVILILLYRPESNAYYASRDRP
jgi:hypothetical protein